MKPEIIEEHTDLVKFYDQCDWAWQIHILMKTYCNTKELIGWCSLDTYLGVILKEYAVLQIAKLHDNAETGSDKNHSLLFYCKKYGIEHESIVQDFLNDFEPFYKGMRKARHKIIAHCDLKQIQNDNIIGGYKQGTDLEYFRRLHEVIQRLYHAAGIGAPLEWSEVIHRESDELVTMLSKLTKR